MRDIPYPWKFGILGIEGDEYEVCDWLAGRLRVAKFIMSPAANAEYLAILVPGLSAYTPSLFRPEEGGGSSKWGSYSISSASKVSCLYASRISGTLLLATLFPATPGKQQSSPSHRLFKDSSNPLCSTECLASSHISTALNLYICAATEYSSINGSLVKANCNGSSVDRDTFKPRLKKLAHGFLS